MLARLGDSLLNGPLSLGSAQNGSTQGEEALGIPLVVGGGLVVLEPLGQLVAVVKDVLNRSRHNHHLRNLSRARMA